MRAALDRLYNSAAYLAALFLAGTLVFVMLGIGSRLLNWFIPGTDGENRFGGKTPPNSVLVLIAAWLVPILFIAGILAAIAVPAYSDYVKRAQAKQLQKK